MFLKNIKQKEAIFLLFCCFVLLCAYFSKSYLFKFTELGKNTNVHPLIGLYFILYAILFIISGLYSIYLVRRGTSIFRQLIDILKEIFRISHSVLLRSFKLQLSKTSLLWIFGFIVVGLILRSFYINHPMRYDEGATYYYFVSGHLFSSFNYLEPNNHVLHTLLARLSVNIFSNHEFSLRLPAFIAGMICLPLIFYTARNIIGTKTGYIALALMAVYPVIILYDTQARGYSLVNMFTLTGICIVLSITNKNTRAKQFLFALNTALGLYVMPTFVFPASGMFIFLCIEVIIKNKHGFNRLLNYVLVSVILTILFTFILYTPVVLASDGLHKIIGNSTIKPYSWGEFMYLTPNHLRQTFTGNTQGVSGLLQIVALVIVVIGVISLLINKNTKLLLLLFSVILGSACIYFLKRSIPFDRTWLFFLPLIFLLFDAGYCAITRNMADKFKVILNLTLFISIVIISLSHIPKNTIQKFNTFDNFNQSEDVGLWLTERLDSIDGMQFTYPTKYTTLFYMLRYNQFLKIHLLANSESPNYFIIKKGSNKISDLTNQKVNKVFELGDAIIYKKEPDSIITIP